MNLLDKLKQEESSIFDREFVSSGIKGSIIVVDICGIKLSLIPDKYKWGVFRPISYKRACWIREPDLVEKMNYLGSLPIVRVVVCFSKNEMMYGTDGTNVYPIHHTDGVQIFDHVICRFDGRNIIYDNVDYNVSPNIAEHLRSCLRNNSFVDYPNMTIVGKKAFDLAVLNNKDKDEERIRLYIARGGGNYISHKRINDSYCVTYEIDGETYSSTVDKNMRVQSAGICLSGTDANFNLQSLMHVVRTGQDEGKIYRW